MLVSIIIPSTSINMRFTHFAIKKIREIYNDPSKVEIIVEENDENTLSQNYNRGVERANGEIVILYHNDMVMGKGFIENIIKNSKRGRILSYHRFEPPLFPNSEVGKSILDCGNDVSNFDEEKFNKITPKTGMVEGGSGLFFSLYKEDYIKLDGNTFIKFCEDDDIKLRYKILGFEFKTIHDSFVYHFVSKTSRQGNYKQLELESNINFIKKWGFRKSKYNKVYKKFLLIKNTNKNIEEIIYPFFNWGNKEANIIVEVDCKKFDQNDFNIIQNLNDIILESGEVGKFEIGNLKVEIKSLTSFENEYIYLK